MLTCTIMFIGSETNWNVAPRIQNVVSDPCVAVFLHLNFKLEYLDTNLSIKGSIDWFQTNLSIYIRMLTYIKNTRKENSLSTWVFKVKFH